jgi:hypothetical protein
MQIIVEPALRSHLVTYGSVYLRQVMVLKDVINIHIRQRSIDLPIYTAVVIL